MAILTWNFDPTMFKACLDSMKLEIIFSERVSLLKNCNFRTLKYVAGFRTLKYVVKHFPKMLEKKQIDF